MIHIFRQDNYYNLNFPYSPIVQKCTKVIEDKLSHIVSDQLNTIMRRKSKRLALMQDMSPYKRTPDNEPEKTPFGRSFLMFVKIKKLN